MTSAQTFPELEQLQQRLVENREKLLAGLRSFPAERWEQAPGGDEWSARQVAEHLIDVEGRLARAIGRSRNPAVETGRVEAAAGSPQEAAAALEGTRAELLRALDGVTREEFEAKHPGPQGEYSIRSLAEIQANHDADHAGQIAGLLG